MQLWNCARAGVEAGVEAGGAVQLCSCARAGVEAGGAVQLWELREGR